MLVNRIHGWISTTTTGASKRFVLLLMAVYCARAAPPRRAFPDAMAVAAGPPVFAVAVAAAARSSFFPKHSVKEKERGGIGNVLQVLRSDRDFLRERLRPLSKALDDLFWLRHLEDQRAKNCPPAAWPRISHPPGLTFFRCFPPLSLS